MRVLSLLTLVFICALMGWLVYTQRRSTIADGDPAPAPVLLHQVKQSP
jgi:hypothetical protein